MYGLVFPVPQRTITPVTVLYNTSRSTSADNSNNSFGSVSYGPEHPTRKVVVFGAKRNTGSMGTSAVIIDGVTATLLSPNSGPTDTDGITGAWFYLDKPTGTSGTVQVNFPNGSGFSCYMACYSIYGAASQVGYQETANGSAGVGSISESNIYLPYGAGLIAAYAARGSLSTVTWTGVTENDDDQVDNDIRASVGGYENAGAETSTYSVSAAYTSSNTRTLQTAVFYPL